MRWDLGGSQKGANTVCVRVIHVTLRAVVWLPAFPSHCGGFYGSLCWDEASNSLSPPVSTGSRACPASCIGHNMSVKQLMFGRPVCVCVCVCMSVCLVSAGLKNRAQVLLSEVQLLKCLGSEVTFPGLETLLCHWLAVHSWPSYWPFCASNSSSVKWKL